MEEAVIPDLVMYWGVGFVASHSTFFSISRYNTSNFPKAPRANEDGGVSNDSQPWNSTYDQLRAMQGSCVGCKSKSK